jgi:hypothetical protein
MLNTIYNKTNKINIKKALKLIFSGVSMFFIGMLLLVIFYDALTGASSQTTAEYCAKYGFLASPDC